VIKQVHRRLAPPAVLPPPTATAAPERADSGRQVCPDRGFGGPVLLPADRAQSGISPLEALPHAAPDIRPDFEQLGFERIGFERLGFERIGFERIGFDLA
jgi:hypothetical protein